MPLVRKYEEEAIANGEAHSWPSYDNYPPRGEAGKIEREAGDERKSKRVKTRA
jgi:hypothetical protein